MKLVVLSDNRQLLEELENEHGLCIYLETEKYKCLLDTGASGNFIENARKMVIYLDEVDYVFISHGHSDHIGGLSAFLELNSKAKIIISPNALTQRFFSVRNSLRDISSSIDWRKFSDRFVFVETKTSFENDIHVFPCQGNDYPLPKANKTLMKENGQEMTPDDFNHELIICFGNDNLLVYTGCAHKGVLNILDSVQKTLGKHVSRLVGGFHLIDGYDGQYETEDEINDIANQLSADYRQTVFYTGHCTGKNAYSRLNKKLSVRLHNFYTGNTLFF